MNKCFYEPSMFNWALGVEQKYSLVKDELSKNIENKFWLPEHPDYVEGKTKNAWQTLTILFWGIKNEKLIQNFPNTTQLLHTIPGLISAQFSLLKAGATILPHTGYSKMVLRAHLPLIVPTEFEKCAIKIENEIRNWKEGELMIFDDSLNHSAWNQANEDRVVLMFDFIKPGVEYTKEEICKYKLANHIDPYLEKIAPKEVWLKWLEDGKFPIELEPPDIH